MLARQGVAVVSGGAYGIDAAAHEGALGAGGLTYAVLGCGIDVVYPDRHARLFAAIAARGALLSEYAPGEPPRTGQFPARNRIIAALAEAVIVVEAAPRSGALITARLAREQGTTVLAVPGSAGTEALLAAGRAVEVHGAEDLLEVLAGRPRTPTTRPVLAPGARFAALVAALTERPNHVAGIAGRLGLGIGEVMSLLTEAELEGWVHRRPAGLYEVPRGH